MTHYSLMGQAHNFLLETPINGSLGVFLPLDCNIKQLVS